MRIVVVASFIISVSYACIRTKVPTPGVPAIKCPEIKLECPPGEKNCKRGAMIVNNEIKCEFPPLYQGTIDLYDVHCTDGTKPDCQDEIAKCIGGKLYYDPYLRMFPLNPADGPFWCQS